METDMHAFIDGHRGAMRAFLKEIVLIQSGTTNKAGVDRVCRMISELFQSMDVNVEYVAQETFGDLLVVTTPACCDGRNIIVTGHMDTVFPADTHFNWYHEDENYAYGPGVIDMKGGLVVGIFALKALAEAGRLQDMPLTFVFNSEEEVGSPVSTEVISAAARKSAMGFVLECGGMQGEVVTGRKGKVGLTLIARGQAGHAAYGCDNKSSAVLALAHRIIALEALNSACKGLTVNVGRITGGIGPNTIPESAEAEVDVRFSTFEEKRFFEERLDEILAAPAMAGTDVIARISGQRPPMEQNEENRALYRVVAEAAEALNLPVKEEYRWGVSDANTIAAAGTPVIDGLGPIGRHDHSDREYMVIESLYERCHLFAATLDSCWRLFEAGSLF